MNKKLLVLVILSGIILAGLSINTGLKLKNGETILGGVLEFNTVASTSGVTVLTSSTLIVASSTGRQYLSIVNDGTNVVYLMLGDRTALVNEGIRLNGSGGSFEINAENLYKGAIRAIASGGSSKITFIESY